jgi:hypothetical protein
VSGVLVVRTARDTIHTHYSTAGGNYYYGFNVDSASDESWGAFVQRSCEEAARWVRDYRPAEPINEVEPYTLGFSLVWFGEEEYRARHPSVTPEGRTTQGGPARITHCRKLQLWEPRPGEKGMTELHYAAYCGNLAAVEASIKAGLDVNARDESGYTPLHWVADMGCVGSASERGGIVDALIAAGADVNVVDIDGETPLATAVRCTSDYLAERLRKHGVV